VCFVCNESVVVNKEPNLKRHYQSKQEAKYDAYTRQFRNDKIVSLERFVVSLILHLYILCSFLHLPTGLFQIALCYPHTVRNKFMYWLHLVSDALKLLHFERLFFLNTPTGQTHTHPSHPASRPSPILRFGPQLKKVADPWSRSCDLVNLKVHQTEALLSKPDLIALCVPFVYNHHGNSFTGLRRNIADNFERTVNYKYVTVIYQARVSFID